MDEDRFRRPQSLGGPARSAASCSQEMPAGSGRNEALAGAKAAKAEGTTAERRRVQGCHAGPHQEGARPGRAGRSSRRLSLPTLRQLRQTRSDRPLLLAARAVRRQQLLLLAMTTRSRSASIGVPWPCRICRRAFRKATRSSVASSGSVSWESRRGRSHHRRSCSMMRTGRWNGPIPAVGRAAIRAPGSGEMTECDILVLPEILVTCVAPLSVVSSTLKLNLTAVVLT